MLKTRSCYKTKPPERFFIRVKYRDMNSENLRKVLIGLVVLVVLYWVFEPGFDVRSMVCGTNEGFADHSEEEEGKMRHFDPQSGELVEGPMSDPLVGEFNQRLPDNILDDGNEGRFLMHNNISHPSCCSKQYPTPFSINDNDVVNQNQDKYVASGYMGNSAYTHSGCMCMTKEQNEFLSSRGGNGSCN